MPPPCPPFACGQVAVRRGLGVLQSLPAIMGDRSRSLILRQGKTETIPASGNCATDKQGNLPNDLGKKGKPSMGGLGSGSHTRWGTRDTVDDMKALRISRLSRDGWLHSGLTCKYSWTVGGHPRGDIRVTAEADHVVLNYRTREQGGDWQDASYPVQIDRTPCHLGGTRPWFLCPARGCGRRAAILYGGKVFACRRCHGLAYPSENEGPRDRATRRADNLRDRLQWPPGIMEGSGWGKPKHMHHATYRRLVKEYEYHEAAALGAMMNWLRRFQ